MKFDDVIINEWGFGSDQPKMTGSAGGTRRDKKAKKIFLDNFMSEILLSLESAISAGLVLEPTGAQATGAQGSDSGENNDVDVRKNKDGKNYLMPGFQEKARRMFNPKMTGHMQYGEYIPNQSDSGKETDGFNNVKSPLKRNKKWQQFTIQQLKDKGLSTQEIQRAYPGFTGDMNEWAKLVNMNYILESIIGKDLQEGEEARDLKTFLRDWYGQWMTGVPLRKTKDTSDQIIEEIFKVYNASKNPNRPVIDRKLLTKLANASYAASTSHGQRPNTGTDRTSVNRTQYMPSYSSSQQAPTNDNSEKQASGTGSLPLPGDATPTTGTADDNEKQSLPQKGIDYDIKNGAILEVGKNRYVYDQTSDTWSGQDGEPANPQVQTALNNWVATSDRYQVPLEPLAVQDELDLKVEPVGEPTNDEFADKDRRAKHRDDKKNTVAESKTKSALRAEKIAQLTTR